MLVSVNSRVVYTGDKGEAMFPPLVAWTEVACLDEKVKMYEKFGFTDLGQANSTWGGEAWHAMSIEIGRQLTSRTDRRVYNEPICNR